MNKYKISLYSINGKDYNTFIIESKNKPDFYKMALLEKANTKNFSHLVVIINDEEVEIY